MLAQGQGLQGLVGQLGQVWAQVAVVALGLVLAVRQDQDQKATVGSRLVAVAQRNPT